jgi:hypothetical protein
MTGQYLALGIEKSTLVHTGNDGKNRHLDFEIPICVGADKCFVSSDNGHMYKTFKIYLTQKRWGYINA